MANHVIFVAPYLTFGSDAQKTYGNARTQAIGRACRFGQKKVVHIYDFVTKGTIDVDLLEKRSHKLLRKVTVNGASEYQLVAPGKDDQSEYGSRIANLLMAENDE